MVKDKKEVEVALRNRMGLRMGTGWGFSAALWSPSRSMAPLQRVETYSCPKRRLE